MTATTAQKQASAKYDRENTKQVILKLNQTTDADILEKLEEVENRQGYIKQLIRGDLRGNDDVLDSGFYPSADPSGGEEI